jgi:NADH dehydrogenase
LRGLSPKPFSYFNKGRLAIIGRNAGVGQIGKLNFTSFLAWFLWLYVHLCYLPGIRNRIGVLINWIGHYFFGLRPARLIFSQSSVKTEISKTMIERNNK